MATTKKQVFLSSAPSSEWPDKAVSILLKTYSQKFSADRGYLRTQDWQDVAYAVNSVFDNPKTLKQCRDKVDSLKRRYKIEKRKAVTGGEVSWPFFHRLDEIMNSVLKQGKMHYPRHPNAHGSADADGGDDVDNVEDLEDFPDEDDREEEAGGVATRERCDAIDVDGDDVDRKEEKLDGSNSNDSLSAYSTDIPPYLENRKALRHVEEDYGMSDEDGHAFNGYSYRHWPLGFSKDNHHRLRQDRQSHYHPRSHHRPEHVYRSCHFSQPQFLGSSRPCTFSGGTQESTENSGHDRAKRTLSHARKRKLECDNGIEALADAVTGLSKPRSTATSFSDMLARIEHAKMEILKKVRSEITKLDKRHNNSSTLRKPHRSVSTSG